MLSEVAIFAAFISAALAGGNTATGLSCYSCVDTSLKDCYSTDPAVLARYIKKCDGAAQCQVIIDNKNSDAYSKQGILFQRGCSESLDKITPLNTTGSGLWFAMSGTIGSENDPSIWPGRGVAVSACYTDNCNVYIPKDNSVTSAKDFPEAMAGLTKWQADHPSSSGTHTAYVKLILVSIAIQRMYSLLAT